MAKKDFESHFRNQWETTPARIDIPGSEKPLLARLVMPLGEPKGVIVGASGVGASRMRTGEWALGEIVRNGYVGIIIEHHTKRPVRERIRGFGEEHSRMGFNLLSGLNHFSREYPDFFKEPVNALGNSAGAVVVLAAVSKERERFGPAVFASPAGFTEPPQTIFQNPNLQRLERFWKVLVRHQRNIKQFKKDIPGMTDPEAIAFLEQAGRDFIGMALTDPLQSFRDGIATANADMRPVVRALREHGQKIGLLVSKDDVIFPISELHKALVREPDLVDIVALRNGHHNQMVFEVGKYMGCAIEVLEGLKAPRPAIGHYELWDYTQGDRIARACGVSL